MQLKKNDFCTKEKFKIVCQNLIFFLNYLIITEL